MLLTLKFLAAEAVVNKKVEYTPETLVSDCRELVENIKQSKTNIDEVFCNAAAISDIDFLEYCIYYKNYRPDWHWAINCAAMRGQKNFIRWAYTQIPTEKFPWPEARTAAIQNGHLDVIQFLEILRSEPPLFFIKNTPTTIHFVAGRTGLEYSH